MLNPSLFLVFLICLSVQHFSAAYSTPNPKRSTSITTRAAPCFASNAPLSLDDDSDLRLITIKAALSKTKQLIQYDDIKDGNSKIVRQFFKKCMKSCHVAPSSIPGAGMGLFATKNIKRGTIVTMYPIQGLGLDVDNCLVFVALDSSEQDYFENKDNSNHLLYVLGSRPLLCADKQEVFGAGALFLDVNPGRQTIPEWLGHFVNDGSVVENNDEIGVLMYYKSSEASRNCVHIPFGPSPLMATVATRDVKKGEELFTSYGCVYWLEALLEQNEECIEITEAIQEQVKLSTMEILNAMKDTTVKYSAVSKAFHSFYV